MDSIKNITKDILLLDNKLSEHNTKLSSMRDIIIANIKEEARKLEEIHSKRSIEGNAVSELSSIAGKLKREITINENKVKSILSKLEEISLDEEKITKLKDNIAELSEEYKNMLTKIELSKTDYRQSKIAEEELIYSIKNTTFYINSLLDKKNNLNNDIISMNIKAIAQEKNIKYLSGEKDLSENILNDIKSKVEEVKNTYNKYNDNLTVINGEIGNAEIKLDNKNNELKTMNTKIKELNEVKDNITMQIDSYRNKNNNEENRLLALKKEVLTFILENKDIGNKKRIAMFAKEVENA